MVGWAPIIASGIAAGGSLLGSSMDDKANSKAARRAERRQLEYSREAAAADRAHDERMAQNQIQWRVADARAAGIHPLAALGASISAPTASQAVPDVPVPQSSMGDSVGTAAAHLGRGLEAAFSETQQLQNDLLRAQVRNVDASTSRMLAEATSRTAIANARADTPGIGFPEIEGVESAQQLQNWVGEGGEWLAFLRNLPLSMQKNLSGEVSLPRDEGPGVQRMLSAFDPQAVAWAQQTATLLSAYWARLFR